MGWQRRNLGRLSTARADLFITEHLPVAQYIDRLSFAFGSYDLHSNPERMAPSDFAKADLSKILEELTTDEAISLTVGVGFWHSCAIKRLGIPAVKVSDGPNGIRGNHFLMSTPAKVLLVSRALPLI